MQKDIQKIQEQCDTCRTTITAKEAIMLVEYSDWRKAYLDYLNKGITPDGPRESQRLQKHITKYIVREGHLYRKAYNGEILRCING